MSESNQIAAAPNRWRHNALWCTALLMGLFATGGASCNQWVRTYTQPRVLPESATLTQIVTVVNDNTAKVDGHSLQSTQASLSVQRMPFSLRATIALQSPRRLRLLAGAPVTNAPELDLGSNDELFWLWVRQNEPPAMFVCRHDQFAFSNARQIIPVEPEWLIEALGLVHFDPNEPLEGPFPTTGGRVQIRSKKQSMLGELKKVTVVDLWEGTVVEQDLYTPDTKLLAISRTSHFTHESQSGAALPRSIDIEWPTAQLSFHLDVTDWLVNAIAPNNMSLWTKPEYPGYPNIDLADPHYQFSLPGSAPPVNRMGAPAGMPANYPARPAVIPPAIISPAPTAAIYPPGATVPVPAAAQAYPPGTSVPLR
jgi:hypothetical protein